MRSDKNRISFITETIYLPDYLDVHNSSDLCSHQHQRWVDDVGEKDLHTSRLYDGLLVITHNEPPRFIVSAHPSD